jgi:hypothetical protein
MTFLGIMTFLGGMLATAYTVWAMHRKGVAGLIYPLVSPLVLLAALTGLVMALVPDFFR